MMLRLINFSTYVAVAGLPIWAGGGIAILLEPRVQTLALICLAWAFVEASLKPEQFARRWFDVAWFAIAMLGVASGIAIAVYEYKFLAGVFPREIWFSALGVGIATLGLVIRFAAIRTLGKFFSYELKVVSGQRIVQEGLYKYLRHPSYTGFGLILIGLPLILNSWLGFIAILSLVGVGFSIRILWEETVLVQHFGAEYRDYQKKTKRLIPFVW